MIGCHGRATSREISIDEEEMHAVSWFSREEVLAALENTNPSLKVPGDMAIAHHLIRSWATGEVEIRAAFDASDGLASRQRSAPSFQPLRSAT